MLEVPFFSWSCVGREWVNNILRGSHGWWYNKKGYLERIRRMNEGGFHGPWHDLYLASGFLVVLLLYSEVFFVPHCSYSPPPCKEAIHIRVLYNLKSSLTSSLKSIRFSATK